jgi:hypothetical protein
MKIFTGIFSSDSVEIRGKQLTDSSKKLISPIRVPLLSAGLIVMMMLGSFISRAQLLLTEDFSYTAGTAATANGWAVHSVAANPIMVTSPSLTYTSHPGSGVGNAVSLTTSGEDINKGFTPAITTGSAYMSCLINMTATQATGDYFVGLFTSATVFPVRVWARTNGAGFSFGVSKATTGVVYEATVRAYGTTYLVVANYVYSPTTTNDDIVNLWVDPILGAAEPAATIPAVNGLINDVTTLTAVFLRQGSATNAATPRVDAFRVGSTWASVTAVAAPPVVTAASPVGTVGTPFTYNIIASNPPIISYAISSGTLPGGLNLNTGTGAITGTPTTAGSSSVDVTATNSSGTSSPATLSFTINPGNQILTGLAASDTKTYGAAPYNLSVVSNGGGANSGNAITFSSSPAGVVTFVGNQVTIVGAGSTTITASQAGNGNWNAATSVTQSLTVNKATQTITFGSLINRNDVDPNFQLTGSASSGLPVIYTSSVTTVAQIVNSGGTVDPNGDWVDITGPGVTTIEATQPGNANYFPATAVQQSQTIINTNLQNQTINFGPLANKIYGGANFQLTATATPSGLPVTYTSSNPAVAIIVNSGGTPDVNGDWVDIVGPGNTTITASQAGNGTYNPAVSVPQNLFVDVKPLTVTGAVADDKVYDGGLAATISGATLVGVESGDIVTITGFAGTFADPNVNTGPPIAVTAGLSFGGADVTKYSFTQPTGLAANITKANQTINFGLLADKSPGDPNFNYTATATSGLPVSYASSMPSVATIVSGSLVHIGVLGSSTITATQLGNSNYFAATPVQQTQNVVPPVPASIFANLINATNPSLDNPFTAGQTFNTNITVSGIGRGTGIVGTSASNRYNANSWVSATFDPNKYYQFTLTPNAGYRIDFSSFAFNSQISSLTGPNAWAVRSSLDGFTANIGSPTSATAVTLSTISLSAATYQGITSAITFRIYGWGATSATSTFSINDFVFNGNVFVAPPTATFTKTNVSVCGGTNDGTITVTPGGTGPFSYSWTGVTGSGNPATTPFPNPGNVSSLTGLPIGYYNVTITDGNLNTVTITGIHIQYAFSVYITNSGSISSACGNTGSIILYGNAGVLPYSYSLTSSTGPWQTSNTFTGLAAGSYTAFVKDGAGCVNSKSITVNAAAPIVVSPFVRAASSCAPDGSIEIYKTGGIPPFSYSLDDITYQSVTNKYLNLAAGPYTAYVKDSKGCISSAPVTVAQGVGISVTANKTNTSTCANDGTIQLNPTGGVPPYMYSIDDGLNYQSLNYFSGLSANTYPAKVKDSKGCTGTLNVTINLNSIGVTAYAAPSSTCVSNNGSIQLFRTGGTGPYTYSLDGNFYQPGGLFSNLPPDYYTGYVKDSKGCIGQLIDILVGPESCLARPTTANRNISREIAGEQPKAGTLKIHAYPNPSAAEFMLTLDGYSTDKISVLVTDVMGRKVYQATGTGKQLYKFGNDFHAGLYNVQVIRGIEKQSIKVIKE